MDNAIRFSREDLQRARFKAQKSKLLEEHARVREKDSFPKPSPEGEVRKGLSLLPIAPIIILSIGIMVLGVAYVGMRTRYECSQTKVLILQDCVRRQAKHIKYYQDKYRDYTFYSTLTEAE